jgi:ubiquinone/menaquinone biosynthesis C-methylase UbiE
MGVSRREPQGAGTLPVGGIESWFRCPRCGAAVVREGDEYRCEGTHRFPIVLGIPDFRLYEDPLIPLADDYRKGERLEAEASRRSFAELVEFYWTLPTYPFTPPDLSARFVHHVVSDAARIAGYAPALGSGRAFLDVGCGAGALLREMRGQFATCVGADVGFRWLIVARRGLQELGMSANLVCCCADALPFASGTFDTVASVALLEHVPDASAVLAECARVMEPSGRVFAWTSNRFSLAPEPHVRVWGVGFLPRRLMPAYVRWRRGLAYEKKHLLSAWELARGLRSASLGDVRLLPPAITAVDLVHAGRIERLAARAWSILRRIPVIRRLLIPWFPVLQVVAMRHPQESMST